MPWRRLSRRRKSCLPPCPVSRRDTCKQPHRSSFLDIAACPQDRESYMHEGVLSASQNLQWDACSKGLLQRSLTNLSQSVIWWASKLRERRVTKVRGMRGTFLYAVSTPVPTEEAVGTFTPLRRMVNGSLLWKNTASPCPAPDGPSGSRVSRLRLAPKKLSLEVPRLNDPALGN